MKLKHLIDTLDGAVTAGLTDFDVEGISCNSRDVRDNFVFVAITGVKEDGHRFVNDAVARGARAVVVERAVGDMARTADPPAVIKVKDSRRALAQMAAEFYGHPSLTMKVVGITGTNGKTSISYLLEAIIRENAMNPAVIGTINYRYKDTVVSAKNTTPGPLELQSLFSDMADRGITHCCMEVSSHALAQERTLGIRFHSALFTNLTRDHLDYHKDMEDYFQAKARLFQGLEASAFAVINSDDPYGRRISEGIRAPLITYGIDAAADVKAEDITSKIDTTRFLVRYKGAALPLETALIGRHNIYNILAVVAWALHEGISPAVIASAIKKFRTVPGRLQRVESGRDFSVFVDYAHTDDALKNVITALRNIGAKRIIVVFGCGGERDKGKREKMGRVVSTLADYAVITNDNPRSDDPLEIIEQIKKGMGNSAYTVITDRREAIQHSLTLARSGDIVLIAGKGHEDYQILKDKVIHFDDWQVAKECLQ